MSTQTTTGYLNAADAAALDGELMSTPGFSLEQLMELAGLSVAEAVYQVLPPSPASGMKPKVLLVCGPGNNGGDGLVAARHLVFFGYECVVVYPKKSAKQHFVNLVQQCKDVDVSILDEMPSDLDNFDGIVDAIFGFSFKGAPREPFATALQQMIDAQQNGNVPVISVDVPSGWNVDEGDVAGTGFVPDVLVSLTTPKESARQFKGRHFVGGRFLPPKLAEKYQVQMPPYPGVSQVMEVTRNHDTGESSSTEQRKCLQPASSSSAATGWEAEYAAYLQEKDRQQLENDTDNAASSFSDVPQNENTVENESWERQYADHCIEKEARLRKEDAKHIEELKRQLE
jgi:NAD(P)H-hydrate epimerase